MSVLSYNLFTDLDNLSILGNKMNTIKNALPALITLAQVVKASIDAAAKPVNDLQKQESYEDVVVSEDYDNYVTLTMIADGLEALNNDEDVSGFMKQELAPVRELMKSLKEKIELRNKTLEIEKEKLANIVFRRYKNAEDDMRCLVNFNDIVILNMRIVSLSEEQKANIVKRMEEQGFVKVEASSDRTYCFLCEVSNQRKIQKIKNYFYKIIEDIVNDPNFKGSMETSKATGSNIVNILT